MNNDTIFFLIVGLGMLLIAAAALIVVYVDPPAHRPDPPSPTQPGKPAAPADWEHRDV